MLQGRSSGCRGAELPGSGVSDGLKISLAKVPCFGMGSNFCWQKFSGLGRAENFVGRSSLFWDVIKFSLAEVLRLGTGSKFCWHKFPVLKFDAILSKEEVYTCSLSYLNYRI